MTMILPDKTNKAVFGENYDIGYIGFTFYDASIVSEGIAYFTRWSKMSDITVSHAFIVTDENECVEALAEKDVVAVSPLMDKYVNDPRCALYMRKPLGWTANIGKRIATVAASEVGCKYDYDLIASDAVNGSFLGELINKAFNGNPDHILCKLLNKDKRWICSELAAYSLDSQPEYHDKGILRKGCDTITPQELFEDGTIFVPWK